MLIFEYNPGLKMLLCLFCLSLAEFAPVWWHLGSQAPYHMVFLFSYAYFHFFKTLFVSDRRCSVFWGGQEVLVVWLRCHFKGMGTIFCPGDKEKHHSAKENPHKGSPVHHAHRWVIPKKGGPVYHVYIWVIHKDGGPVYHAHRWVNPSTVFFSPVVRVELQRMLTL